jgi:hypothetical protein
MVGQEREESVIARMRIRLRTAELSDREFERLFETFEESAATSVVDVFGRGFTVKLSAREGSLVLTATVLGVIAGVVGIAVGVQKLMVDYEKMKEGLVHIVEDVKKLGHKLTGRFIHTADVKPGDIETIDIEAVAPEQWIKLLDEAAKFRSENRRLGAEARHAKQKFLAKIRKVSRSLSKEDKKTLLGALEKEELLDATSVKQAIYEPVESGRQIRGSGTSPDRPPTRRRRRKSKTIRV